MTIKSMSTTEPSIATSNGSAKSSAKWMRILTPSKPSMASATATTNSSDERPNQERPSSSPPRGIWSSRLARLIFAWNFVGFAVLTLGVLLLSELREQLIQAKIDALATQGELVANVLAETATIGDPAPQLLESRAAIVLERLGGAKGGRARPPLPPGRPG